MCIVNMLVLAATLTACAGAPRTGTSYQHPGAWKFVQWALSRGPMWVDIRGEPYLDDAAKLNGVVTAAMEIALSWIADPRFTADPEAAAERSLRFVLSFNADISAPANCTGSHVDSSPDPSGEVRVVATLCDAGNPLSHAKGSVTAPAGPTDPAFSALIRQITRDLLPRHGRDGGNSMRIDH